MLSPRPGASAPALPKSPRGGQTDKFDVVGAGGGGMEEMCKYIGDNEVSWALLRFEFGSGAFQRSKVLFLHFNGEETPVVKRGQYNALTSEANMLLTNQGKDMVHASLECKLVSEITAEDIIDKVSHYFVVDNMEGADSAAMVKAYYEQLMREREEAKKRQEEEVRRLREEREAAKKAKEEARKSKRLSKRGSVRLSKRATLMSSGLGGLRLLWDTGIEGLRDVATGGVWNWVLFGPDAKELPLLGGGSGSVDELRECAMKHQDTVMFGLLRLSFGEGRLKRTKYASVHIIGDQVPAIKRGKQNALRGPMVSEFKRFANCQVSFHDYQAEDLSIEEVIDHVRRVSVVDDDVLDGQAPDDNVYTKAAFEAALKKEQEEAEAKVAQLISEEEEAEAAAAEAEEAEEEEEGEHEDEEIEPEIPEEDPNAPPNHNESIVEIVRKVRVDRSCNWALLKPKGACPAGKKASPTVTFGVERTPAAKMAAQEADKTPSEDSEAARSPPSTAADTEPAELATQSSERSSSAGGSPSGDADAQEGAAVGVATSTPAVATATVEERASLKVQAGFPGSEACEVNQVPSRVSVRSGTSSGAAGGVVVEASTASRQSGSPPADIQKEASIAEPQTVAPEDIEKEASTASRLSGAPPADVQKEASTASRLRGAKPADVEEEASLASRQSEAPAANVEIEVSAASEPSGDQQDCVQNEASTASRHSEAPPADIQKEASTASRLSGAQPADLEEEASTANRQSSAHLPAIREEASLGSQQSGASPANVEIEASMASRQSGAPPAEIQKEASTTSRQSGIQQANVQKEESGEGFGSRDASDAKRLSTASRVSEPTDQEREAAAVLVQSAWREAAARARSGLSMLKKEQTRPMMLTSPEVAIQDSICHEKARRARTITTGEMPAQTASVQVGGRIEVVVENEIGRWYTRLRKGTLGQQGTIVEDDGSPQPYLVRFDDGRECWYKARWVQPVC